MPTNGNTLSKGCPKVRIHSSKDLPTRWMYQCTVDGCQKVLFTVIKRDEHARTCSANARQFFSYVYSDCDGRFDTETVLSQHRMDSHDWVPKQCKWLGCNDTTVFELRSELRFHTDTVHRDHLTQCWVCDLDLHPSSGLKAHVRRAHPEITEDVIDVVMPFQKAKLSKQMHYDLHNAHIQGVHRSKSSGNGRSTHSIEVKG